MDAIKTYDFKNGHKLEIHQDDNPQSPREDDNLGTMVCFHKRYNLGDENHGIDHADFGGWSEMEDHIRSENPDCIILPLFLYDHSGLTIKVGSFQGLLPQGHAEYDSGRVGFIFITRDKINAEFGEHGGRTDEQIEEYLQNEVAVYNQYLQGDIYGYQLIGPNCEECDGVGKEIDACWGFYGCDPVENGMIEHIDSKYHDELKALV